jgi:hypothetical protein
MQRHAKELQKKSREHLVQLEDITCGRYRVTSAGSGKQYLVNVFSDGKAGCSCDWSKYHNDQGATACSHAIAVLNHVHKAEWNTVSAWSSVEQANKQHRQVVDIGNGVLLTVRPHRKIYTQLQFAI